MNNLYRPACLAASYIPISKREHIKPREVMSSNIYEWLEKANAEAAYQAHYYDEECLDIPF